MLPAGINVYAPDCCAEVVHYLYTRTAYVLRPKAVLHILNILHILDILHGYYMQTLADQIEFVEC